MTQRVGDKRQMRRLEDLRAGVPVPVTAPKAKAQALQPNGPDACIHVTPHRSSHARSSAGPRGQASPKLVAYRASSDAGLKALFQSHLILRDALAGIASSQESQQLAKAMTHKVELERDT